MISPREVQHIAKLARISLNDTQILQFQKDLGSILEYFEILHEVRYSTVPDEVDLTLPLQNVTRQDVVKAKNAQEGKRLLEMGPETKDGYLKVKSIL